MIKSIYHSDDHFLYESVIFLFFFVAFAGWQLQSSQLCVSFTELNKGHVRLKLNLKLSERLDPTLKMLTHCDEISALHLGSCETLGNEKCQNFQF